MEIGEYSNSYFPIPINTQGPINPTCPQGNLLVHT